MEFLFFLVNSFLFCRKLTERTKGSKFQISKLFFLLTPFIDMMSFLNLEYEAYLTEFGSLCLCLYRLLSFFALTVLLYHCFKEKWVSFVTTIAVFINASEIIVRLIHWRSMIFLYTGLFTLGSLFMVFSKYLWQKHENDLENENLKKVLELTNEAILILREEDNDYKVEYFNYKLLNFLRISKKSTFKDIDSVMQGFFFKKVKCRHVEKSTFSIPIGTEFDDKKKPFDSLKEVLKFYKTFAKSPSENMVLSFIQRKKKSNFSRLKFDLKQEIIENNTYFYLTIEQIEKRFTLSEKSDSKNRLLSAFTHELKTPLNGAIPTLQEVKIHSSNTTNVFVDRALASLKLLENSLNNIIDYSLISSNQFIIHLSKVNIEEIMNEVFLIVKSQVEVKNLRLTIEIDTELLMKNTILTDYNRLKQLILNILLNAIQFTSKGKIMVLVQFIKKEMIRFTVEDTGYGISHEKLDALKRKLKEGEKEQNDIKVNNTGFCLGLIICQKIALLLGNRGLDICSSPNKGTIVQFLIRDQTKHTLSSPKNVFISNKNNKNERIIESSKHLYTIRTKNLSEQRTLRTQKENFSVSGIFSEDDKTFLRITDSDINLEKVVRQYDAPKFKNFSSFGQKKKICSFLELKEKRSFPQRSFTLSQDGGCPSILDNTKKSSPKGTKIVSIVNSIEDNDRTKGCRCADILIVDDDAFNLLSLEMILSGLNFRCAKALNGMEAIRLLKENKNCGAINCKGAFQLIFMDYQMPLMDGVETTMEIKGMIERNEIENTPIIGCTAFTAKDEVERCLNAGMKDVIFKPLNKNVIGEILKDWVFFS